VNRGSIDEVLAFITSNREEMLVVTHFFPDGDAVGSLIAFGGMLQQRGIPFQLAIDDPVPERYGFMPGAEQIANLKIMPLNRTFSRAAVLDAGALERIGRGNDGIGPGTRLLDVDHHFTTEFQGHANCIDSDASATAVLLYRICLAGSFEITSQMATALFVGILTDTGRFRFSNTTPEAMIVCGELLKFGVDASLVTEQIFHNLPAAGVLALGKALSQLELHCDGRVSLISLAGEDAINDTEGFVEHAASIRGVEVAAFLCQMEPRLWKASLRSRSECDVSLIAGMFGGGGHRKAAGFRYRGTPEQLKEELLGVIEAHLANGRAATGEPVAPVRPIEDGSDSNRG